MSRVCRKGYVIQKENYDEDALEAMRKDLTVKPRQNPEYTVVEAKPYSVFLEGPTKMYLPRFYGTEKLGQPAVTEFPSLPPRTALETSLTLRDYQQPIVDSALMKLRSTGGALLDLSTGAGKCLGIDTPVMMFDGTVKKVQDIAVGDRLMGDDSSSREVLALGRGCAQMYRVKPNEGAEAFTANSDHILTLTSNQQQQLDISIEEFLRLDGTTQRQWQGFQVPVSYNFTPVEVDAWKLGYWLGDGFLSVKDGFECCLKSDPYDVIQRDKIPPAFLYNSREIRLEVLAGLLDARGILDKSRTSYCVSLKSRRLLEEVIRLARSLGYSAGIAKCAESYKVSHNQGDPRYFTFIYGPLLGAIPCREGNKQAISRGVAGSNMLHKLEIESIGTGDYYGFTLDGNGRFLLGDFTVTHNTNIALYLICQLKVKSLIIVHKSFLMDQWRERIEQFIPQAMVGMIRGPKADIRGNDIVIGMLQTLCGDRYDDDVFESFGMTVVDECLPSGQHILTEKGPIEIGKLYAAWMQGEPLPQVLSLNEETSTLELKPITYAWKKHPSDDALLHVDCGRSHLRCTANHRILTADGYKTALALRPGDLVLTNCDMARSLSPAPMCVRNIKMESNPSEDNAVFDIEVSANHNYVACSPHGIGVIVHNCHHISAETFCRVLPKLNTKYNIALSATMTRKDGLSKVFKWYLGDVAYKWERKGTHDVIVKHVSVHSDDDTYSKERRNFRGGLMLPIMINQITEYTPRNQLILHEILQYIKEDERHVMVLSDRIKHLTLLKEMVDNSNETIERDGVRRSITTGFYTGGGPTGKKKQRQLKESESKDVIFASFMMAKEGLDIGSLNTLILATPTGDVVQAAGRILRKQHAINPLIVDFVDLFSVFAGQAQKRSKFYRKCKYHIHNVHWRDGESANVLDVSSSQMCEEASFNTSAPDELSPVEYIPTANAANDVDFLSDSD